MVRDKLELRGTQQIFSTKPHSTWDNYFSGDQIFNWLGANGFAATTTCQRDRLPSDIPKEHMHSKKMNTSHQM